ncbi:MAG TPA: DUF5668 domain-containing protein [Candidatus Saccharimonadales bacterium]|jgi:hypothetical protein|nr:DUF5668 domain-containing protein [Candidatus Saccharimonadales bacterium]
MNCAIHAETPAAAYCRTCGKAMCDSCKRDVMGAIYCEPCLAARIQGATHVAGMPAGAPASGAPNPGIAAWLGLIPGVGAMYNGQFVKALVHVVIILCLIAAANSVESIGWIFACLIAFFWLYMVIDANKTARAMQLGQPVPDMLGLDRMFNIHESHAGNTGAVLDASVKTASDVPLGAVVLIGIGVIFLMGNFGLFRLLHLGKLWPVLMIGLGLWIIYRRTAPSA